MNMIKLQNRLSAIIGFVRSGIPVFDIGTDHALIPVALAQCGHSAPIIASDIAEGPVERAKKNIRENGFDEKIKVIVADGLEGIDIPKEADIIIAGMGGELIRDIIDRKKELRRPGIRLILQPMTKPEALGAYLASEGFEVLDGMFAADSEDGKIYRIYAVSYTGKKRSLTPAQLTLGEFFLNCRSPLMYRAAKHELELAVKRREGKRISSPENTDEDELIFELKEILSGENL